MNKSVQYLSDITLAPAEIAGWDKTVQFSRLREAARCRALAERARASLGVKNSQDQSESVLIFAATSSYWECLTPDAKRPSPSSS